MAFVFLSHSSKDKPLARKIANDLLKAGIDVWLDEWEILIGDSITQRIQHGLEEADFVAVLLTKRSVESGWVEKEWQTQVGVEASSRRVVILPLKADDCSVPALLQDKKYADFRGDYSKAVHQLIEAVKGHGLRQTLSSIPFDKDKRQQHVLQPKESTDVLIIEDDLSFAYALAEFIEHLGYTSAIAVDTQAALEMVRRYKPRAVIVDTYWSASGYFDTSLIRYLRDYLPNTRIVGLTAWIDEARMQQFGSLFDAIIVKPATRDDVIHALALDLS